jgi:hypothetical protein
MIVWGLAAFRSSVVIEPRRFRVPIRGIGWSQPTFQSAISPMNSTLLITAATAVAVVYSVLGVWFGRLFVKRRGDGHHEVLGTLLQTGGTMHAVFLAFLVVAVWQSYDAARGNVAEEASSLTTLYRSTVAMDQGTGSRMREAVRGYVQAVIDKEWRIQAATGGASEEARAASLSLYRILGQETAEAKQVNSAIDGSALELLSQIQSDRNRRTLQAGQSLPSIVWLVAIGSGAIVLAMSFLMIMEHLATQVLATSLLACTIALLLCTTLVLSRPFSGPMAIQADSFIHSVEVFHSVDAMLADPGASTSRHPNGA